MKKTLAILFGQAVRRHREKQEISQEAFAEKAGIHRTYASSIERGKVQVSIAVAQKLAEALGIPQSRIWREIERELSGAERAGSNDDPSD